MELYGIVIMWEPFSVMIGGVKSTTVTVLFCVMAILFELSVTSYDSMYVPIVEVSTIPVIMTLSVMLPSTLSVASYRSTNVELYRIVVLVKPNVITGGVVSNGMATVPKSM